MGSLHKALTFPGKNYRGMNEKARFGGGKQVGSVILSRVLWENYTLVKDFCLTICPHSVPPNNNKHLLCSTEPEFHECHGHVGGLSQVTVTMSRGNKSVSWDSVIIPRLSFPKATHSHGWRVLAGYRQETPQIPLPPHGHVSWWLESLWYSIQITSEYGDQESEPGR